MITAPSVPIADTVAMLGKDTAPWVPWLKSRLELASIPARVVCGPNWSEPLHHIGPRLVLRLYEPDMPQQDGVAGPAPRLLLCDSARQVLGPALCGADDVLFGEGSADEAAWRLSHWWCRAPSPAAVGAGDALKHHRLRAIVQSSPSLAQLALRLPRYAQSRAPVLVLGETGTGKELFARAVHYLSPRADRPMVTVNCAALPPELVDSEFFGHARGAFTSAHTARAGLVAQAEGGTLFLDEVDSLPLPAQGKLLRLLQEQEYRPVGADRTLRSDVRIVAASNRSVEALVRRGEFRQDLFYRLNVLSLPLPALRERRQDIWHLATHFIARFAAEFGTPRAQLGDAALRALLAHHWPGNVRELEHLLERVCLLHAGGQIEPHELGLDGLTVADEDGLLPFREAKLRMISRFERDYLEQLLTRHQGNVTRAAAAVQKNRRALLELLHRHGIDAQDFRPTPPGRSPRPSSGARPRPA